MGMIAVRFSAPEEHIVKELSKYYHEDRSKIVKRSLLELYEDLIDKKEIETFIKKESKAPGKLYSAKDILKELEEGIPARPLKRKNPIRKRKYIVK
jgi:hypothetical protein